MRLRTLARYPFLTEAREFIREQAPPLDRLLVHPLYYDIRDRAYRRVMGALSDALIPTPVLLDEESARDELLSYPLARMMVSVVADNLLVARYSLAEAKSAGRNLEQENIDFILHLAGDLGARKIYEKGSVPPDSHPALSNVKFSRETDVIMHFTDYLRGASSFTAPEWKMVNRELEGGFVALSRKNLVRLIEEMIRNRLLSELPLPVTSGISDTLAEYAKELSRRTDEIKEQFRDEGFGEYSADRLPPCLKHLISDIQANINLSHEARFFMAAFLFHIGLEMDNVVAVFSQSPDFNASMARYQLEHIKGDISGTKYTPPACGTLKTNGICHQPDSLCRRSWMNHPLTYYRVKGKKMNDKKGDGQDAKTEKKPEKREEPVEREGS